jgi:hypothetical protein
MATLSGQKIKDAFASILKLNTNTATTSLKNVESGDGVATALQLSTQKVGINGTQNFVAIPLTDNAEFTGLLIDGNGDIVKRELNAAAFAGATITGATLPLTVSGSNVTVANPSTLTALTTGTASAGDRFLIYDASTTTWKRIDLSDLKTYVTTGVVAAAAGSDTQIQFNDGGVLGASSLFTYSDTQIYYGGRYWIVREQSAGSASTYQSSESYNISTGTTNGAWFVCEYANFKGIVIDYVAYTSSESRKRIGRFTVAWDSSTGGTAPVYNDSVDIELGSSTTSELTLSASIVGSNLVVSATNSVGETMYLRGSVKMFYSH